MLRLATPFTVKPQPITAEGLRVSVESLQPVRSAERVNSIASYWYWFSHGVPLADA
ncbi:hypothetical protein EI168_06450 [Halomonas sp. FME1]|uniref:Uncharacterized protein n=1 Tax=Halomonas casei TaxID=2742613 RepID=A0ABR9EZV2_9GAMM|nr:MULTISPECIES: hypothetical protein [Halomonas]MBE0399751.1 hypothetical protein [Halomonas casei]